MNKSVVFAFLLLASATFASVTCGTISVDNNVTTLDADLTNDSTCFTISAQNVTINCNGHSITGNNSSGTYGVYSNQFNTTVKNCIISNFSIGIYFGGTDGLIQNNTVTNTYGGGNAIQINGARNNLTQNTITAGNSTGIAAGGQNTTIDCNGANMTGGGYNNTFGISGVANYLAIRNCNISGFDIGISFWLVNYSSITNVNTHTTQMDGITMSESYFNNVTNCTGNSTKSSALFLYINASSNIVINFTGDSHDGNHGGIKIGPDSSNNRIIGSYGHAVDGDGIYVSSGFGPNMNTTAHNNSIINSTGVSVNGNGIEIQNGNKNNTVFNSIGRAENSGSGIRILYSSNNMVTNCTGISGAGAGFTITSTPLIPGSYNYTNSGNHETSSYNAISNSTAITNGSYALNIINSTYSTIANIVFANLPSGAIKLNNASNSLIANNTFLSTSTCIYFDSSSNNTVSNSQISGNNSTNGAIALASNSANNTIANSTINGLAGAYALTLKSGSNTGNRFINNTFLNATVLAYLDASASSNTFYWNNFTNIGNSSTESPLYYVQDLNGNNAYIGGSTADGTRGGNFYANVLNGSVNILGNATSPNFLPAYYIGTNGTGYPYGITTSNGKFACNFAGCTDALPFTLTGGAPPTSPTVNAAYNITPTQLYDHYASTALRCTGLNLDGGNLTYNWTLYKNGAVNLTGTAANFPEGTVWNVANITDLTIGTNWTLQCSANNSVGSATANTSSVMLRGCQTFTEANVSRTLENNISISGATCFNIPAENVTIDCNGYSLLGNNATSTIGIHSVANYTVIRNCNISNFADSIMFSDASYGSISNTSTYTTFNGSGHASGNGIYLSGDSFFNNITDCFGDSTWGDGVYLGKAGWTIITNYTGYSQMPNCGGIKIAIDTSNNQIINSRGYSINGDGLYISSAGITNSHNNSIINSTGISVNGSGITVWNRDENNTIINSIGISDAGFGIKMVSSSNNVVTNSTGISNQSYGIVIATQSDNVTFTNCTAISNSTYALYMESSANNTITGSTFTNLPSGAIKFSNVSGSVIANITFLNAGAGTVTTVSDYYSDGIFLNVSGRKCDATWGQPTPMTLWLFGTVGAPGALGVSYGTNVTFDCMGAACAHNNSDNFSVACMNLSGANLTDNLTIFFDSTLYPYSSCAEIPSAFGGAAACYSFSKNILLSNGVNRSYTYNPSALDPNATFIGGVLPRLDYQTAITLSGNFSVYLTGASANNNITNNTFNSTLDLYLNAAVNTTVWWNTFDGSFYARDVSGTNNNFNTSVNGQQEGNIWADVLNGSVAITGTTASNYSSSYFIGSAGSGYPYSSATSSMVYGITDYAPLILAPTPAAPSYGGSNYLTPSLSYSFNCSSGALSVTAKTSSSSISGLTIHLKDPSATGYLALAPTDSAGKAYFAINASQRYSLESAQTGSYSAAYHEPFTLTLCQSAPSQPSNETPVLPEQPAPPKQPQAPASTGQTNKTTPEIPSTTSQGGTGAQNGAQNPLAPIISELPPAVQEAAAPALGLMVIGGGALAVAAGLVAYYFIAKRRKPRKPA